MSSVILCLIVGDGVKMLKQVTRKVSGGKFVKLRLDTDTGRVLILGDFFLHPEEKIEELQQFMSSLVSGDEGGLQAEISCFLRDNGIQLVGFSDRDLAELLAEARR